MLGELTFEFDPSEILEKMRTNRETHATEYAEALKGYYLEVAEQAKEVAKKAREVAKFAEGEADKDDPENIEESRWNISAIKPEDHTGDYDRVIAMLEMTKSSKIELDEQEFAQYVLDKWAWKQHFETTNNFYSAKFGDRITKTNL